MSQKINKIYLQSLSKGLIIEIIIKIFSFRIIETENVFLICFLV